MLITHKGKIDIIYIDPPYNTESAKRDGNQSSKEGIASKFLYKDKFGRGGWLNMMKARLDLAKQLLSDNGIIFVSIDDNEQAYLKVLMDDIFGEQNFLANLIWKSFHSIKNDSLDFSQNTEYILCFSMKKRIISEIYDQTILDEIKNSYLKDESGNLYISKPTWAKSGDWKKIQKEYKFKNGKIWKPEKGTFWRYSFKTLKEYDENDLIIFDGKSPYIKIFFNEEKGKKSSTLLPEELVKYTMTGDAQIKEIFGEKIFPNPKPTNLIKFLLNLIKNKNAIILDFFAGSGTTGHAVMELNKEDGGNRKFILCANNENNIAYDVTYERLYRIINGNGTKEEKDFKWLEKNKPYLQTKLRVIKIDDSIKISLDEDVKDSVFWDASNGLKLLDGKYKNNKGDINLYYDLAALNPLENDEDKF